MVILVKEFTELASVLEAAVVAVAAVVGATVVGATVVGATVVGAAIVAGTGVLSPQAASRVTGIKRINTMSRVELVKTFTNISL
jgi:hypothetical protein